MDFIPDEEPAPKLEFVPDERRKPEPKALGGFSDTGGGAAVGNPMLKGTRTYSGTPTDIPYEFGGHATEFLSKMGLPASMSAAGGVAANLGMSAIPALMGGGAGKAAAPLVELGAEKLMQSALKPSAKSLLNGKAAEAIQTMFDEGINVSRGGVEKLQGKISALNDEIKAKIAMSSATIDKNAVYGPIHDALNKFARQANPQADIKTISNAWNDFVSHPLISGDQIPVQLAQELKQGTYRAVRDAYGKLGNAWDEAQKGLGRGIKDQMAAAVPGISAPNAAESALLNAKSLVERRALMEGNKNIGGLAPLGGHGVGMLAFMADRNAALKSVLARLLHWGSEGIPEAAGASAGTMYSLSQRNGPQ